MNPNTSFLSDISTPLKATSKAQSTAAEPTEKSSDRPDSGAFKSSMKDVEKEHKTSEKETAKSEPKKNDDVAEESHDVAEKAVEPQKPAKPTTANEPAKKEEAALAEVEPSLLESVHQLQAVKPQNTDTLAVTLASTDAKPNTSAYETTLAPDVIQLATSLVKDIEKVSLQSEGLPKAEITATSSVLTAEHTMAQHVTPTVSVQTPTAVATEVQRTAAAQPVTTLLQPNTLNINRLSLSKTLEGQLLQESTPAPTNTQALVQANTQQVVMPTTTVATTNPLIENTTAPLTITTPVMQEKWGEAVTERVMWMSAKGIREANIQLDPPELGPLSVKVSVTQEQAQVSFTVHHAGVREMLDQNAVRLRELFAEEGLNLVDVDVSDQSQSGDGNDESETLANSDNKEADEEVITETVIRSDNKSYSLIDSYV